MLRSYRKISTFNLSNGAVMKRTAYDCEICIKQDQDPGPSEFSLEFENKMISICAAHAQAVLDMDEDELEKKGGEFGSLFSKSL